MFQLLPLDSKTVFELYFLGNLFVCILIFSYSFSYAANENKKTLKWFGYSKLLLTIGWIFLLLRNSIPDFISINIANSIVFTACCYETAAILSMLKAKSKKAYWLQIKITIAAIVVFNAAVFLDCTINTRILIASIVFFVIYLQPSISYFAEKGHNLFRIFYGLCYVCFEILTLIRIGFNYLNPQTSFFSYGIFDSFYNIGLFLLSLISTVGFLLLVKEKQDIKIKRLLKDRNQFFSIIAHDLKGPLGASVGLSEVLVENIDKYSHEEIKGVTEVLYQSNKNSYKLLENLLEWSQVQTGMIVFNPKKLELTVLIKESIELNRNTALHKNISILFEPRDFIDVRCDKNMINTIVRNLLSNAIKFTYLNGEVVIRVERDAKKAVVSVTDNGIGIPDNIKEKLFKISGKVTQPGTEDEIGTGLGLLLCSEFVKKHDGEIWVESEVGKGSTFKFTLPL